MPGAQIGILGPNELRVGLTYTHFDSADLFGPEGGGSKNLGPNWLGKDAQIVNSMNIFHLTAEYGLTERFSVQGTLPYTIGERFIPVRDQCPICPGGNVLDRFVEHTNGVGDAQVMLKGWLLRPSMADRWNVQLGIGIKIPTGQASLTDVVKSYNATTKSVVTSVGIVDQSMQPGDGGWGIPLYILGNVYLSSFLALYAEGYYLLNPQDVNGADRGGAGIVQYLSIPDEYYATVGAGVSIPQVKGLALSLGLKVDGIPQRDLLGPSNGFRRPGYEFSLDPTVSYSFGANLIAVNVPWFFYKRKEASVGDLAAGTAAALAAFAAYSINVSFVHQFSF